jgi:poly(rC)-binding protein 2/3/4
MTSDAAKNTSAADDNAASTPGSNRSDKQKDEINKLSGDSSDAKPGSSSGDGSSSSTGPTVPPSANIHMRCLIVTQDASIIIGKGGSHVNEIREKSGARVMVSESIPGNPERILNVSGPLDAVSKASPLKSYVRCVDAHKCARLSVLLYDASMTSLLTYLRCQAAVLSPLSS